MHYKEEKNPINVVKSYFESNLFNQNGTKTEIIIQIITIELITIIDASVNSIIQKLSHKERASKSTKIPFKSLNPFISSLSVSLSKNFAKGGASSSVLLSLGNSDTQTVPSSG